MTNNEFYYLVLVCGAFAVFGVATATNYIRYRQWDKQQARTTSRRR
jgi:hypothetical protein